MNQSTNLLFMRFCSILLLALLSSSAFAGGCPPWLPCGKRGNLIIADPEYGSVVAGAVGAAAAANTSAKQDTESVMSLTRQIQADESYVNKSNGKSISSLQGDDSDALKQRESLRHPASSFWGYDWGNAATK